MNAPRALSLCIAFALIASLLAAAPVAALEHEGAIRFRVGNPTGAFGNAVPDPGYGLSGHYGMRPVPTLTFGIGADFLVYGSEKTRQSLPLVEDFDLTTTNNLAGAFLFAQWRPVSGPFEPYVEGRLGGHYLWTESKLEDKDDFWDDDDVARETNFDDFALFWAGGGGFLIKLRECDPEECRPGVFLDFKVLHVLGGEAEYLTEGDIEIVDGKPEFAPKASETDLTTYELGVVLTF